MLQGITSLPRDESIEVRASRRAQLGSISDDPQTSNHQTTVHEQSLTTQHRKQKVAADTHGSKEEAAGPVPVPAPAPPLPTPMPPPIARAIPLLVCGIGNPGSQYANTLHSAGLSVLKSLAERLGAPAFHKERSMGNGLVSKTAASHGGDAEWTLWQSTAYMNESGKGVRDAYAAWSHVAVPAGEEGRLVVVHDELEKPLGSVTVRTNPGASAKGHNGLKSILAAMGNTPFARIGIGVGRPVSRDSDDVARYVLRKIAPEERLRIDGCVDEVIAALRRLEKG